MTREEDASASDQLLRAAAHAPAVEPPTPAVDLIGQSIDRFLIEALVGSGGFGSVYRARDPSNDRQVAVKLLVHEDAGARFEQEARLLAALDHPSIVAYVGSGRVGSGRAYLVMEWLEGVDLSAYLKKQGTLSVADTWSLARQVADALAFAHARGVVHRDIKPSNLFLVGASAANVKVLDFGIARSTSRSTLDRTVVPDTKTGTVLGTIGYMAPEQACGSSQLDGRVDVFALGCVMFECLTGQPAFAGANAVAVLAKLLLEDAPRPRHFDGGIPKRLDALVARMMAREPAARPSDGAAVLRAIDSSETSESSESSSGLADREKRLVTVVLVRGGGPPLAGAIPLADGGFLVEHRGEDSATQAAATALAVLRSSPEAAIAIATGRVAERNRVAYGPILDRVATLPARAGSIAIDDVSAALLGDRFQVTDGLLLGPARRDASPRTLLGRSTPFVGRDKELAFLQATVEECIGEPITRSVVVTGRAGSGKSRLCNELLRTLDPGVTVLVGRGDPVGAGSALGLARQLVRDAAAIRETDPFEAQHAALVAHLDRFFAGGKLARHAEVLGELVGAPAPEISAELRALRNDARTLAGWLARSFSEWIAAAVDEKPLIVVLEDLHWGDGASIGYLDDALRANPARPLFVLALARPEVHDLFPGLFARAGAQEVRLPGLTKRAAERLVRSVLRGADDPAVGRIVTRGEGNPFHLEELIRHESEHALERVPDSVLALAESRLARLAPEARRVARVASVFGETFWAPGVAATLDGAPEVEDALRRLVDAEVVEPSPEGRHGGEHRFRHSLLRDAAYAMLTETDRAILHLRAGEWLEREGEQAALVLAEHFERAGQGLRAAPSLLRAAMRALESWDTASTEALAERGIRCGATGELLGLLHLVLVLALGSRGESARAFQNAEKAYSLLPPRSPHWYEAAAGVLYWGLAVGSLDLAPVIVQELLTTTPDGPPTGPYGNALRFATEMLDSVGQLEASELLVERAAALHAAAKSPDPLFAAHLTYARTAMAFKRDIDIGVVISGAVAGKAAVAQIEDALGKSKEEVRPVSRIFLYGEALLRAELGDIATARSLLSACLMQMGGTPVYAAWCAIHIGWCDVLEGRYGDAVVQARKAFEHDPHHAYALAALAHLLDGDRSEAERLVAIALRGIDDGLVTPYVVATAFAVASRIALAAGRLDEARDNLLGAEPHYDKSTHYVRSLVDRTRVEVGLARGEDVGATLARAVARIDRHARSIEDPDRSRYRSLPENAWLLERAQR